MHNVLLVMSNDFILFIKLLVKLKLTFEVLSPKNVLFIENYTYEKGISDNNVSQTQDKSTKDFGIASVCNKSASITLVLFCLWICAIYRNALCDLRTFILTRAF